MSKLRSPFLPTKETLGIVRHIEAEAMVPYCRVIIKNEITLFSPQYRSTGLATSLIDAPRLRRDNASVRIATSALFRLPVKWAISLPSL